MVNGSILVCFGGFYEMVLESYVVVAVVLLAKRDQCEEN